MKKPNILLHSSCRGFLSTRTTAQRLHDASNFVGTKNETSSTVNPKKEHTFLEYLGRKREFFDSLKKEATAFKASQATPRSNLVREFSHVGMTMAVVPKKETQPSGSMDAFAMESMMEFGLHLGHSIAYLNRQMTPYLFGIRQGIHIINLEQTLHCLRRALLVTREIARLHGVILIVGTRPSLQRITYDLAVSTESFYIFDRWQPGTLTNASYVVKKIGPFTPGSALETAIRLPDLMIVLDGPSNAGAFVEAAQKGVPTIGICDSNMDPTLMTYPIPMNDDSIEGTRFVADLFKRAIIEGAATKSEDSVAFEADTLLATRYNF